MCFSCSLNLRHAYANERSTCAELKAKQLRYANA